jgi:hypothetical protein
VEKKRKTEEQKCRRGGKKERHRGGMQERGTLFPYLDRLAVVVEELVLGEGHVHHHGVDVCEVIYMGRHLNN